MLVIVYFLTVVFLKMFLNFLQLANYDKDKASLAVSKYISFISNCTGLVMLSDQSNFIQVYLMLNTSPKSAVIDGKNTVYVV